MRKLLAMLWFLTIILTLWCSGEHLAAPGLQIETKAELSQSQATQLSDADIDRHVSRVGRQGRNSRFAALLAGASAVAALAALILASKKKI